MINSSFILGLCRLADLFGLDPGIHKVELSVVVPEGLRVESVLPDSVEVDITVGPPITPTLTLTPTSTPTADETPTP